MSRAKKKHVCSCGEEFNHGIGLRKHQRQSGHKGSSIVDDEGGDDEGEAAPAAPPPAPAAAPPPPPPPPPPPQQAPPPPPPVREPEPPAPPPPPPRAIEPKPVVPAPPPPRAAQASSFEDESDQTIPVNPRMGHQPASAQHHEEEWDDYDEGPSRFQHNRQKLSLVSTGLKVIAKKRSRTASVQLKQSARSGADIFAEASKIAVSLLLLMAIPAAAFWWWWSQKRTPPPVNVPNTFSVEEAPLAARTALLQYLDSLDKERWSDAYGRLSPAWQEELSSASFQEAFSGISDVRWAVSDQKILADGSAEVNLVLAYVEDGRGKKFQGRFRLIQEGPTWKVDRAELSAAER